MEYFLLNYLLFLGNWFFLSQKLDHTKKFIEENSSKMLLTLKQSYDDLNVSHNVAINHLKKKYTMRILCYKFRMKYILSDCNKIPITLTSGKSFQFQLL